MPTITDDGPLAVTRRRLTDAVAALADPTPVGVGGGVYRWSPSLYASLRGALQGTTTPVRRARVSRSRLPCRLDVLALLVQVDQTVATWEPHGKTTIERLHELAGRGWRPQDCELLDGYSDCLQCWVLTGTELLGAAPRISLRMPCPNCNAQSAYHHDGAGERVRVRALRVSESGCRCLACGAFWGPELFEWLARLMGCPALPA